MWGVNLSSAEPFIYSIFGIQYLGSNPTDHQASLIQTFDTLLSGEGTAATTPTITDKFIQEGAASVGHGKTQVWLSYWPSSSKYQAWWTSEQVKQFWTSLPADAGMWREILTVSDRRTQYGSNVLTPSGLRHLGEPISVADKSGYWGCYRHRMAAHTEDKMESSLAENLEPMRPVRSTLIVSPASQPTGAHEEPNAVCVPGRIIMTKFPENICFVVEGQDHSLITPEEKDCWFENFDALFTQWVVDLVDASSFSSSSGQRSGILDTRIGYVSESGKYRDSVPEAMNYNRKIQLFYFNDLQCMVRIGSQNKGHVALRKSFMQAYGPGGNMEVAGKICLWVETSVLKGDEIECEYVGCFEGTGFMAFRSYAEFK